MIRLPIALLLIVAVAAIACDDDDATDPAPTTEPSAVASAPAETEVASSTEPAATSPATIRLLQPGGEISAGTTFTVIVRIIGATNLGAYQFAPMYDPVLLELVEVRGGDFIGSTGRPPTCLSNGAPPSILFLCATIGREPPGPSGDGDLAFLEFQALAAGEAEVSVDDAVITTPDARDIPFAIEGALITLAP